MTEALLYMRRATPDKFRRYTIVAENSVAISRRDVELTLKGLLSFRYLHVIIIDIMNIHDVYGYYKSPSV